MNLDEKIDLIFSNEKILKSFVVILRKYCIIRVLR